MFVSDCQTDARLCHYYAGAMGISFTGKLWQVFRIVILGGLDSLKEISDNAVTVVMDIIDTHIECFFFQVLKFNAKSLRLEALEINDEKRL